MAGNAKNPKFKLLFWKGKYNLILDLKMFSERHRDMVCWWLHGGMFAAWN